MWKTASRSVKSIFSKQKCFQKRISFGDVRNEKSIKCSKTLIPKLFSSTEWCCRCEDQKAGTFAQTNKKEYPKKHVLNGFHNILGALGLSGVCALGWYILQSFSQKKVLFSQGKTEKCLAHTFCNYSQKQYFQLVRYFISVKPYLYVLPNIDVVKPKKNVGLLSKVNQLEVSELEQAHRLVVGSISNYHGANCMDKSNYAEAIAHFEKAAQVHHPAGIYNLGVCYEIGLGTKQDFKKAAVMYKRASDLGHPIATYNLGVFYVHGLGDLKTDLNEAKKLFQIAASQGQPNAQEALNLNSSKANIEKMENKEDITTSKGEYSRKSREKYFELSSRKQEMIGKFEFLRHSFINADKTSQNEFNSNSLDDSGALDLSPEVQILIH